MSYTLEVAGGGFLLHPGPNLLLALSLPQYLGQLSASWQAICVPESQSVNSCWLGKEARYDFYSQGSLGQSRKARSAHSFIEGSGLLCRNSLYAKAGEVCDCVCGV